MIFLNYIFYFKTVMIIGGPINLLFSIPSRQLFPLFSHQCTCDDDGKLQSLQLTSLTVNYLRDPPQAHHEYLRH